MFIHCANIAVSYRMDTTLTKNPTSFLSKPLSSVLIGSSGDLYYRTNNTFVHINSTTGQQRILRYESTIGVHLIGNDDTLYFTKGSRVLKVLPDWKNVAVVAGTGVENYTGDGGLAIDATFSK